MHALNDPIHLHISGMSCVSCAGSVEKVLRKVPGVTDVSINFATSQAVIHTNTAVESKELVAAVASAGYRAHVISEGQHGHAHHHVDEEERVHFWRFIVALIFTLPLFLQMFGMLFGLHSELPAWMQALLATVVQFACGWQFYTASYRSAKLGSANMDLLIAVGTTAAYVFSMVVWLYGLPQHLYFESSSGIITLILFGRWLEAKSKKRASEAIQKLLMLQPKKALVERDGQFIEVSSDELNPGAVILIRPGEGIPADAQVIQGESSVDEAMLTGESMPVSKHPGKKIFAGTVNQNGSLKAKVIHGSQETTLAAIVRLIDQAQNSKAPVQRFADAVSEVFVPVVLVISLLTFLGWWWFGAGISTALINSVAVLIIACPCALGLATPTVILVSSGRAAGSGIIFKDAAALELVRKMQIAALDKTGTVTEGHPTVSDVIPVGEVSEKTFLEIIHALEINSQHPLAKAIVDYAKERGFRGQPSLINFVSFPGKGVSADIEGKRYVLGSVRFSTEEGLKLNTSLLERLESEGKTISVLWQGGRVLGYIAVGDRLRETSVQAIDAMHKMGIETVLLTGDHKRTASAVAAKAGIKRYYSDILPEEKAQIVKELKSGGQIVGMIGDGINDAPALATASIGFAIGAGTDIAIEASDVTLIRSDLMSVVQAVELSKATFRKIQQNLFFAFIYNILGIPLAALGLLNPLVAAAAMSLSSVSVIFNALLLKRWEPKN